MSSGCRMELGRVHDDPHTVCITCRGGLCDVDNRCAECASWSPTHVLQARKYQLALRQGMGFQAGESTPCQLSVTEGAGTNPSLFRPLHAVSPSSGHSSSGGASVPGSVGPGVSGSQVPGPPQAPPWDMAEFFKGFATFLGLPVGQQHVPLPTMLSELVSEEVQRRLANPTSLPAPS